MFLLTTLSALMLSNGLAAAPDPSAPTWRWAAGQERTWYIESRIAMPFVLELKGARNIDARTSAVETRMVLRCAPERGAKLDAKAVSLRCNIDDIALAANSVDGDEAQLQQILSEYDSALTGAGLDLRLGQDGKLGLVNLTGVPKVDSRSSDIHETMRLLVLRAVAGLDLQLPETSAEQRWKQRGTRVAEYPSATGTQSFALLEHSTRPAEAGSLAVHGEGETTLRILLEQENNQVIQTMVTGMIGSEALFDVEGGALQERCWFLNAEVTADALDYQSAFALDQDGRVSWRGYSQVGTLLLLTPDGPRPDVGETGVDRFVNPGPLEAAEAWIARNMARGSSQDG